MTLNKKRIIFGAIGAALIAGVVIYWVKHNKAKASTSEAPASDAGQNAAPGAAAPKGGKPGVTNGGKPGATPSPLGRDGEGLLSKILIAKNTGSVIYNTILKEVGKTTAGATLGKSFKATKTSNGTYNIKYSDENGQFRIINSAAVNVK